MSILAIFLGIGVLTYAIVFVFSNRHVQPKTGAIELPDGARDLPEATSSISVLTWNIGYAGLGEKADLVVDNGRSYRPLSAVEMSAAAQGIAGWLSVNAGDVNCLQENANAGFLTRKVPVRHIIEVALPKMIQVFWSDMRSMLAPSILHINHGMSVHSRVKLKSCHAVSFPKDDTYFLAMLKKHYGAVVSRFAISDTGSEWVVFNVHLSAFDTEGYARLVQLEHLMQLATQEYERGNFVVIAGDWNMGLAPTEFAHRTDEKDLLWVADFPDDVLPESWQLAVDATTPTVRSLDAPYEAGKNYTSIVDGFVFSPNVNLERISTADLRFQYSDHNPVSAQFVARLSRLCTKKPAG